MRTGPPAEREPLVAEDGPADPRRELVERVAHSAAFRKSKRLQDLLLFICGRVLRDPDCVLHEQEIGIAVFGRPADFDSSQDTLVRVQASQLRKRLQQYFSGEGAQEPMVIEIPKGRYAPIFRERERERWLRAEPAGPEIVAARSGPARLLALAGALALASMAWCVWLFIENRALQKRLRAGLEPRPAVDLLWQQMFGNGHQSYVILADGTVTMFQDLIQYQLSPTEYQRQTFKGLAESRVSDPGLRDMAVKLMNRQFTSIADAALIHRVARLNAAHGIATEVLLARDAGPGHFRSQNVILSGPRRANPWVELFEEKLNFRSRFTEDPRRAFLENRAPRAGEQPTYAVEWDRLGYCRVAYLPNLDGTGSALVISGTDMTSTDAGAEFITSERWVRQLRAALGARGRQPLPHFEVLLRTAPLLSAAPNFEMIAHRVH